MKTKTLPVKKMTKARRLEDLQSWVSVCFAALSDLTHEDIAWKMGVHPSTVWRLWSGSYTLAVRFGTIQSLAFVAGLRLVMTDSGIQARIVD